MNQYASTLTETTHAFHTYFHKEKTSASWCSTSVNTYFKLLWNCNMVLKSFFYIPTKVAYRGIVKLSESGWCFCVRSSSGDWSLMKKSWFFLFYIHSTPMVVISFYMVVHRMRETLMKHNVYLFIFWNVMRSNKETMWFTDKWQRRKL